MSEGLCIVNEFAKYIKSNCQSSKSPNNMYIVSMKRVLLYMYGKRPNLLLTKPKGHSGEYWSKVISSTLYGLSTVRLAQKWSKASIP